MINEIDPIPALDRLLVLLRERVLAGAGEDEFNVITRAIELISERRLMFRDEEQAVYYVAADEPTRAPYRVTGLDCTCPRGHERICKHRLLVAALEGKLPDTSGFTYTKRTKKQAQEQETIKEVA